MLYFAGDRKFMSNYRWIDTNRRRWQHTNLISRSKPGLARLASMAAGSGSGVAFSSALLLLLLLLDGGICDGSDLTAVSPGTVPERSYEMVPSMVPLKAVTMELMLTESKTWSMFQTCEFCTCCADYPRSCMILPCCYFINCSIPNRPFGFCSFTAKSCGCTSCN